MQAIIDTGAMVNVISENLATKLGRTVRPSNVLVRAVNGDVVTSCGEVDLNVQIGPKVSARTVFIVLPGFPHQVLCGLPFCKATKMVLDFPEKKITLQGHQLPLHHEEEGSADSPDTVKVQCLEELNLPPRTEALIAVRIAASGTYLVEPLDQPREASCPSVARTLTVVKNHVGYIRVANTESTSLLIPKNSTIGRATTMGKTVLSMALPSGLDDVAQDVKLGDQLPLKEKMQFQSLVNEYGHLFSTKSGPIGRTTVAQHEINTEAARPIQQNPYRSSPYERQVVEEQIREMLTKGVVRTSTSAWSSPVVLVRKRDGSWRFCVDFRKLNAITKKDVHPLPRVDDIMDKLQGSQFFTTLDLASGYWQVPIKEQDKEKTAFSTGSGLYEFNVVPFGLCNAPATFQRTINKVLANQLWKTCLAYLDDIIVFSRTSEEHLRDLREIFQSLDNAGLKLQPSKCYIAFNSIRYLGHIIDGKTIRPDPDNTRAVHNTKAPTSRKQVRSFLGLCGYYRRFVKDFARIARPLNELTKMDAKFIWDEECQESFETLKQRLTSDPVLRLFDPELPIELHTDACGYGIGAVLVQKDGTEEFVVGYASRHLNQAEMNYSTTEQECLAVVYATRQFRPYIFGAPVTVVTDQASLTWLMTAKNQNGRLIRWSLLLQEFNLTLRHRPGARNMNADALSRLPYDPAPDHEEELPVFVISAENIPKLQMEDPFLRPIILHLQGSSKTAGKKMKRVAKPFSIIGGTLYRRAKGADERLALAVPRTLRREVLSSCHDDVTAGHLGVRRTLKKIRQRYFWPKMFAEITHYVQSCPDCQTRNTPSTKPAGELQPLAPTLYPFQQVGMDFVGPLTESQDGNKYIVVMVDYYTKWVEAVATPEATAACAARAFMESMVLRHGAPERVITDRGSHFTAEMMEELFQLTNTNHARSTAYHPQTNGQCERFNRTLAVMISKYVSAHHRDWDQFLQYVIFAYNSSVHETTGYSPFYLLHGKEPTLPIDATLGLGQHELQATSNEDVAVHWEEAKRIVTEREYKSKEKSKERYDATRRTQDFEPGDLVHIRMPTSKRGKTTKFVHPYHGPFRIVRRTSANDWEVESRRGKREVVNVERLKPFIARETAYDSTPQGCPLSADKISHEGSESVSKATTTVQTPDNMDISESCESDGASDYDDDEFFDAIDFPDFPARGEITSETTSASTDEITNTRPRRVLVKPRQEGFVYY